MSLTGDEQHLCKCPSGIRANSGCESTELAAESTLGGGAGELVTDQHRTPSLEPRWATPSRSISMQIRRPHERTRPGGLTQRRWPTPEETLRAVSAESGAGWTEAADLWAKWIETGPYGRDES